MLKRIITTPAAGKPVGPYSQAMIANGLIFVSAEKGVDPATGKVVGGGVRAQTTQALINIETILNAAGSSRVDVVRCVVYLHDIGTFSEMNEAYGAFFTHDPPARTTVGVAGLPLGLEVLIEATAVAPADDASAH